MAFRVIIDVKRKKRKKVAGAEPVVEGRGGGLGGQCTLTGNTEVKSRSRRL